MRKLSKFEKFETQENIGTTNYYRKKVIDLKEGLRKHPDFEFKDNIKKSIKYYNLMIWKYRWITLLGKIKNIFKMLEVYKEY